MATVKNKIFDKSWWGKFIEKTQGMSEANVFKNCIRKEEILLMRSQILEMLASILKLRTSRFGFRVYVDGKLLENNEMIHLFDYPPVKGESIEDWSKRVFGNKRFGMIVNQGERFNPALSKLLAFKLKPLLELNGMPTEGIIFTLFIGNYDKTPLGIHLDLPGKSVIHFHLGPGKKTMYTWDNDTYEGLVGEQKYNNQNIQKYIPFANKYEFGEGDLYFMPEDIYHVGTQEGLSMAIGCWYNNRSMEDFSKQILSFLTEKYLITCGKNLKADKNEINDISIIDDCLSLFDIPPELEKLSFKDLIREEYRDFRYSLFSNAGYRTNPPPLTKDVKLQNNDIVQLELPFLIKYKDSYDKTKLHIFIRGTKIEFNNFSCLKLLIDKINTGATFRVAELIDVLDEDWSKETGVYIISTLIKYKGISLIKKVE
ncbi:hypothetical protein [Polaribacter cellanae]|uniref:JmjC domain-containing protein n=1 Tax=Polaribacter cellanae TaxID=2818493 RepID=A0A975CT81_9FLAO|nr:hypothetical protein [Polaribacter cellanae]QTE23607.1 hypothetical protein J3359_04820 [Polaribacter cellanae]